MLRWNSLGTVGFVLALMGWSAPASWACNCISSGGSEHLLNTYVGITLLISLLPILMVGGGIFLISRLHQPQRADTPDPAGISG